MAQSIDGRGPLISLRKRPGLGGGCPDNGSPARNSGVLNFTRPFPKTFLDRVECVVSSVRSFHHLRMKVWKTPDDIRRRATTKRHAIKLAGGEAYAALLERERAARKLWRDRYPWKVIAERKERDKTRKRKKSRGNIFRRKFRDRLKDARRRGIEATIRFDEIHWPTHCPVLGIELDYKTKIGTRLARNPANPSLDRWDNTKGYVSGNVYVISYRANILKNNANADELESIARYARHGPAGCFGLLGALRLDQPKS
jgi:hypothetical protein